MKILRLLALLSMVSLFAAPLVRGADVKNEKTAAKTCDCKKDKDGKTCGVDKDCCCTGKKATKTEKKG